MSVSRSFRYQYNILSIVDLPSRVHVYGESSRAAAVGAGAQICMCGPIDAVRCDRCCCALVGVVRRVTGAIRRVGGHTTPHTLPPYITVHTDSRVGRRASVLAGRCRLSDSAAVAYSYVPRLGLSLSICCCARVPSPRLSAALPGVTAPLPTSTSPDVRQSAFDHCSASLHTKRCGA